MRKDYRQKLTDELINAIESNHGLPWEQGWRETATRPFNPVSGLRYRGGNVINLMLRQAKRGSNDPRWMTLKQANAAGYRIRKGAKGACVEYWDWGQPKQPRKAQVDELGNPLPTAEEDVDAAVEEALEAPVRRQPRVFYAVVFNGEDVVGLPPFKCETTWKPHAMAEALIAATGARIEHRSVTYSMGVLRENAAYYSPSEDKIVLPPREYFKSDGDYYATVLHEIAHWTGHASRLNRDIGKGGRHSPEYAREELRAEIASMFLISMIGINGRVQNHARYVDSWLEALKSDRHEIFRAARDAERIVDHVFSYAPVLREVVEARVIQDNLLPRKMQQEDHATPCDDTAEREKVVSRRMR